MKTLFKNTIIFAFIFSLFIFSLPAYAELILTGVLSNNATGKIEVQDNSKITATTNTAELNIALDFDPDGDPTTRFKLPDGVSQIFVTVKTKNGKVLASQQIISVANNRPTKAPIFAFMYPLEDFYIASPDPNGPLNKAVVVIEDGNSKPYYQSDEFQVFPYTAQTASTYLSGTSGTNGTNNSTNSGTKTGTNQQNSGGTLGTQVNNGTVQPPTTPGGADSVAKGDGSDSTAVDPNAPKSGLQITLANPLKSNSLEDFVQVVLGVILKFLIPILAILFIYTGFQLVTSRGDKEALKKAKNNFFNLVIGAVLILGAWTFGSIIMNTLKEVGILN